MPLPTDVRITATAMFLLPVDLRVPLKFGGQVVDRVTCVRIAAKVRTATGATAIGWGETPLVVQWGWPSETPYAQRHDAMIRLAAQCARAICDFREAGHALEIGQAFREASLASLASVACAGGVPGQAMPELAALICLSPLDLAIHDAYGRVHGKDVFATYGREYLSHDLAHFFAADGSQAEHGSFRGLYPSDFLTSRPADRLLAWHLVGGLDPLDPDDLTGREPDDGHPLLLTDWLRRDGIECLKIKLRGDDLSWDIARLTRVGRIGLENGVSRFCADFNCMVSDARYVHEVLDAIGSDTPEVSRRLLYVEQPFAYEFAAHPPDLLSLTSRTRLFLDESAHDWRRVCEGHHRGWNGVALKTCKTMTGALLSLARARRHGMDVMVQDLTNPMLATIPHVRLAAHAETLAGVETNASQFYPEASGPEATVHPGIYRRRGGKVDLRSLAGPGFGMRVEEIPRTLPDPFVVSGEFESDAFFAAAVSRRDLPSGGFPLVTAGPH